MSDKRFSVLFLTCIACGLMLMGCPAGPVEAASNSSDEVRSSHSTGSLTVTIGPQAVRSAGAQWRVDEGTWRKSGDTVKGLRVGTHTVSYREVTGWSRPEDRQISIVANKTATATGTYLQKTVSTGSLHVLIGPAAALTAGAKWNVDGGAWRASGDTATGLASGNHTLAFSSVTGWTKPASSTVSIIAGTKTEATGTYVQAGGGTGSLHVVIGPAAALTAGAKWNVDGGAWHNSGDTVASLVVGQHTLTFSDILKWTKPAARSASIVAGQTTEVTGTYTQLVASSMVVLGYNDLGMHCMNEDFSEFMILPPYNNLHATVIDRSGEEPHIVTSGVTINYTIPSNTHSSDKTNFWDYANALLGVNLPNDIGLTGNGLSGSMKYLSGRNDWAVTGIPLTPIDDNGVENPYPLATISVMKNGQKVAETQAVVPVSWEISCGICHNTPGISVATDILRDHDRLHPGLNLESQKPVVCGSCHGQAPLGTTGTPSLSRAMHGAHATRMAQAGLDVSCYACHPGIRTQCQRDIHYSKGITCQDCHGSMSDVADPTRRPWQDEPRCDSCHTRAGFEFEQPGTLYRDSKGHKGVQCSACHGSPHAITPTVVAADNVQAIALQGHAGTIDTCTVCHQRKPNESFPHRLSGD